VIRKLNEKLKDEPNLSRLHMEPFEAIRDLLRNREWRSLPDRDSIGGAPQMMKVFQYCQTASFAFMWPDSDGTTRPFLNGRPCLDYENLDIMCLDPDTFEGVYMGGGKGHVSEVGVESLSESSELEGNLAEEEDTDRGEGGESET
jgi:hypothetical protein